MGIWDTYRAFSPPAQRALAISPVLGLSGLTAGAWLDVADVDWWEKMPFIQSLTSSLIGFLIGVPIALAVLATFTSDREQRIQLARVNSLSHTAWVRFHDAVAEYASNTRTIGLTSAIQTLDQSKQALSEFMDSELKKYQQAGEPKNAGFANFHDELAERCSIFIENHNAAVQAIGTTADVELGWSRVVAAWAELAGYVKMQRDDLELPWIPDTIDSNIRNRIVGRENPMLDFMYIHENDPTGTNKHTMASFRRTVDQRGMPDVRDDDKFGMWLLLTAVMLSKEHIPDYVDKAMAALFELTGLLQAIMQVDLAEWPGKYTFPVKTNAS